MHKKRHRKHHGRHHGGHHGKHHAKMAHNLAGIVKQGMGHGHKAKRGEGLLIGFP